MQTEADLRLDPTPSDGAKLAWERIFIPVDRMSSVLDSITLQELRAVWTGAGTSANFSTIYPDQAIVPALTVVLGAPSPAVKPQPGAGLAMPIGAGAADLAALATKQQSAWDILVHLFPTSVFDAMARGDILQVVVFSIFFGIALAAIGEKGRPVYEFLDSVAQLMFKFTGYVMLFAPVGVTAAIAATVGGRGLAILWTLGKLILLMYGGLTIFAVIVIGGVSWLIRVPFLTFLRVPCFSH